MATATAPGSAAPVSFDTGVLKDDSEFLGVIVTDESTQGDHGPQWHYAIKPVDYDLGGSTGAYHEYVTTSTQTMRSKFGIALTAFVTVYGAGAFKQCGAGEMVGTVGFFKRTTQKFGKDRQTKQDITVELILPIRKPNAEEIERAKGKMSGAVTQEVSNPTNFTEDEVKALVELVAGKTQTKATAAVVKSKLPNSLKGAVLNGTAIPALLEQGHLILNGDILLAAPEDGGDEESEDEDSEEDDTE